MAPRTLKETYARKKSSEFVESAIAIHGQGVAATLAGKLTEELREGEEMQDISFVLELLARRLARMRTRLIETAQSHADELTDNDTLRTRRKVAMTAITKAYVAARNTVTTGYKTEDAAAYGFEVNVATVPAQMELQVERLLVNFSKPEVRAAEPLFPAIRFDPEAGEAMFRPLLDELKSAQIAFDQKQRRTDATLLAKDNAVSANDVEFTQISRCFESVFALADRVDLAKRVRPSSRRPGRRQEVEDEPGPPSDTASDGSAPENNVPDTAPESDPEAPPSEETESPGTSTAPEETGEERPLP